MLDDLAFFNYPIRKNNPILNKFQPNQELIDALYSKVLKNSDDLLDTAIQCYLVVCQHFSYDFSYIINQTNHHDINYLETISLKNNKILCYEFAIIFSSLLKRFSIPCDLNDCCIENYGKKHWNVFAIVESYLLRFDIIIDFFQNDFYHSRLKMLPNGIKCLNQDEKIQQSFQDRFCSVVDLCYNLPNNYRKTLISLKQLSCEEKNNFNKLKKIFTFFVHNNSFEELEFFNYIRSLIFDIFSPKYQIYCSLLVPKNETKAFFVGCLNTKMTQYKRYFVVNDNKEITWLNKIDFLDWVDNNYLDYMLEDGMNTLRLKNVI